VLATRYEKELSLRASAIEIFRGSKMGLRARVHRASPVGGGGVLFEMSRMVEIWIFAGWDVMVLLFLMAECGPALS